MSIDTGRLRWDIFDPFNFDDVRVTEDINGRSYACKIGTGPGIEDKYAQLEKRIRLLEIALSQFTHIPDDLDAGELL